MRYHLFVLTFILSLTACGPTPEPPVAEALPKVPPMPDLAELDPAAAEQFRQRHDFLERRLATPQANESGLAWAFGQLGVVYHAYRFLGEARDCYTLAMGYEPNEFRWAYLLGHVERTEGRFEDSDQAFRKALQLRPVDPPTLVWLGENALDQRRLDDAQLFFSEAIAVRPQSARAHFGLGRVALEQNVPKQAVLHLKEALTFQREATSIHYTLGLAWSRLGETEEAQSFFERIPKNDLARVPVVLDDPLIQEVGDLQASAQSYARRGMKAIAQERFTDAVRELSKSVEINPERPDTRYNLAASLLRLGHRDKARSHLEHLVEQHPNYAQGFVLHARLLMAGGDHEMAREIVERALAADPQSPGAQRVAAQLHRQENK